MEDGGSKLGNIPDLLTTRKKAVKEKQNGGGEVVTK